MTSCSQASGKCEAIPYSIALSCVEDASAKRCSQSRGLCPPDKSCTAKSETYSDAYCDQATGLCKPITPKTCTVDCDCDQGQLCHFGSCLTGFLPVYCCTKSGCEKNKRCTDSSGKASACPGSNPCVFAAGTCVLQGDPCPIGYSKSSSVKCGDALPVDCCTPNSP